ncbi:MAG: 50S ribosomal protein L24 [Candidatus Shapirobacteria bacterium]|nr:50S ribosomal protein L24 [Candidatus Shapirobacteria bacterium]
MKILKGDKVKILIGKDKNREGEIIRSFPKSSRVTVKGLNIFKKHIKPTQGQKGSIIEKERPMNVCKVALICPQCKKATRVGYQIDKAGDKSRICKKCQAVLVSVQIKK